MELSLAYNRAPKYIKCQQAHSNKPMSGAGSPSCRPGSVQLNVEKYETANWSLRQGDEEVNKRIKQKDIYLNKLPNRALLGEPTFHTFPLRNAVNCLHEKQKVGSTRWVARLGL